MSYDFFREGTAKGCFPGMRLGAFLCVLYIACFDAIFKTCMYVSTAGYNTNPPDIASHHLPRNGWGEYTGQQDLDCSLNIMSMFTLFLYIHAMVNI